MTTRERIIQASSAAFIAGARHNELVIAAAREALLIAKELLSRLDDEGKLTLRHSQSDAAFGNTSGVRDALRELDHLLADLGGDAP